MKFKFCPNCGSPNTSKQEDFKCVNCKKSYYQNSKPTGSVIPVFQGKEILLGVRNIEPRKGALDVIGGFLNNGEDPKEGTIREFEEEAGLKLKKEDLQYLGIYVDKYDFQGDTLNTFNVTYYIDFPEKLTLKPNDDIGKLVWVKLGEIEEAGFPYTVEVFRDLKNKLL